MKEVRMRKTLNLLIAGAILAGSQIALQEATAAPTTDTHSAQIGSVHTTEMVYGINGQLTSEKIDGVLVPARAQAHSTNYNGYQFATPYICQDDNIGAGYYYPTIGAGNYFEYGDSNVVLASDRGETYADCLYYSDTQTIHYYLYNDPNGPSNCYSITGSYAQQATYKQRTYTILSINTTPVCNDGTAQLRANNVSRGTGQALGLADYNDSAERGCVQNNYMRYYYDFASSCDTGRLHWVSTY